MRFAAMAVALCGCNPVFGLDKTHPTPVSDAQFFDAPKATCPPLGGAPRFSRTLHQIAQHCIRYTATASLDRAAAYCFEPINQVAEGPADGPLVPVPGLEETSTSHRDFVRISPEGDELFVRSWEMSTVVGRIRIMRRAEDGVFAPAPDLTIDRQVDSFVRFGAPTLGPRRRMFVFNYPWTALQEFEFDSSNVATVVGSYTPAELGTASFTSVPELSPDGTRVIFGGQDDGAGRIMYSDRATIDDRFRPAVLAEDAPFAPDPFLSADCTRLYFSAVNSILWVEAM